MNGKGGAAIKSLLLQRLQGPNILNRFSRVETSSWGSPLMLPFRVSCASRVLTGGSSIEAGIDWACPRVPFRVSTRILGLNIEAGIDWACPRVLLRVSIHILDRIASNPSSPKLSDFDYLADQNPLAVFALANWE